MRKIECDKCGRNDLSPTRPEWWAVEVKMPKDANLQLDLCERCIGRLKRWCTEQDPVERVERAA